MCIPACHKAHTARNPNLLLIEDFTLNFEELNNSNKFNVGLIILMFFHACVMAFPVCGWGPPSNFAVPS
jgi:hypothetical protein